MPLMSVALETSHPVIGPCGPLGQSPLGDKLRHAATAPMSSDLDDNPRVLVHAVGDKDPEEPVNMSFLLAFELSQAALQSFRWNDFA